MPVEIRELIIKTEISTNTEREASMNNQQLIVLKEELSEMCKRMFSEEIKKKNYRR